MKHWSKQQWEFVIGVAGLLAVVFWALTVVASLNAINHNADLTNRNYQAGLRNRAAVCDLTALYARVNHVPVPTGPGCSDPAVVPYRTKG